MKHILFLSPILTLALSCTKDQPCDELVTLTTHKYQWHFCSDDLRDLTVDTTIITQTMTRCEAEHQCQLNSEAHQNGLNYLLTKQNPDANDLREIYLRTEWQSPCIISQ